MAAAATARRVARWVYFTLISLFLAGVLVQAFLIGQYLFAGESSTMHMHLGWILAHNVAPLALLLSFFLKGGKAFWIPSIIWGVVTYIMPILATMDEDGPSTVAALHPVAAMTVLLLSAWLLWRAWGLVSEAEPTKPASPTMAPRPTTPPPAPRGIAPPVQR